MSPEARGKMHERKAGRGNNVQRDALTPEKLAEKTR